MRKQQWEAVVLTSKPVVVVKKKALKSRRDSENQPRRHVTWQTTRARDQV